MITIFLLCKYFKPSTTSLAHVGMKSANEAKSNSSTKWTKSSRVQRLFATPNGRKSKKEYSIIIENSRNQIMSPVAFCTVQQCGFFLETGFRVNGLDIIVFGNHFFWSFLCILLGIRTQTYRNPTYFLF